MAPSSVDYFLMVTVRWLKCASFRIREHGYETMLLAGRVTYLVLSQRDESEAKFVNSCWICMTL